MYDPWRDTEFDCHSNSEDSFISEIIPFPTDFVVTSHSCKRILSRIIPLRFFRCNSALTRTSPIHLRRIESYACKHLRVANVLTSPLKVNFKETILSRHQRSSEKVFLKVFKKKPQFGFLSDFLSVTVSAGDHMIDYLGTAVWLRETSTCVGKGINSCKTHTRQLPHPPA